MKLNGAQEQAVKARGNVVVMAGAGTGKTRTLVERCLDCLLNEQPRARLDEMVIVTFTEAAAAEMRERIRQRLEQQAQEHPDDGHWDEQLALFECAQIGTLHSYCFRLVREHFYSVQLDPQVVVLSEAESRMLAEEILDEIFREHYTGNAEINAAVRELLMLYGGARNEGELRKVIRQIHNYRQTLADPEKWLQAQMEVFSEREPVAWRQWLLSGSAEWRNRWLMRLQCFSPENLVAVECRSALTPAATDSGALGTCIEAVLAAIENCPRGKKGKWVDPLKALKEEVLFLKCLLPKPDNDPLAQDWEWSREFILTTLQLADEFARRFREAKRQLAGLDFQDLEQYALELLWDRTRDRPTELALQHRKKLRFVFVDEYQDINAAQDKIIAALSREGPAANRFLVGDVKQSIYRFRLAAPEIFQRYAREWDGDAGTTISLQENFRSREGILSFVNSLFSLVMAPELGGVAYDQQAQLVFGAPGDRSELSQTVDLKPRVELHFRLKPERGQESEGDTLEDLDHAGRDARGLGLRLLKLHDSGHTVWDEKLEEPRPVRWSDMAVLLRARSGKADVYAREFSRLGIPLHVERGGFYECAEITDLLSIFSILDNPLQDIPLLAVLRSPLVGLGANELAAIRLRQTHGAIWAALVGWHSSGPNPEDPWTTEVTRRKAAHFLSRYSAWRELVREAPLARTLETILDQTEYITWLLTQDRGAQRVANVQRLIALAREFDSYQGHGVGRFLAFLEAQKELETEPDVPATVAENAVRFMSIHQSKGLEFPVVAVADLSKNFNQQDLRRGLMFDEEFGLCAMVKPPQTGRRYPSLPLWLARQRQQLELLGEELRLLYVGLTRARDTLILGGSLTPSQWEKWQELVSVNPATLAEAHCAADWVGLWFGQHCSQNGPVSHQGANGLVAWDFYSDEALCLEPAPVPADSTQPATMALDTEAWERVRQRLQWAYPWQHACALPAKSSVSALRRSLEPDEEAGELPVYAAGDLFRARESAPGMAAEIGTLHHEFLESLDLSRCGSQAALQAEADRLVAAGRFTREQAEALDLASIARFWNSDLGRRILESLPQVQRELPFTCRFSLPELAEITDMAVGGAVDDFVVVQGVVDLAVVGPEGILIVDFKTDSVSAAEVPVRAAGYAPQLKFYGRALESIYGIPVTGCWLYFLKPGVVSPVDLAG